MPTNRTRRRRARRELTDDEQSWLRGNRGNAEIEHFWNDQEKLDFWNACADDIIIEHAELSPGSRPLRWWEFSAPEMRRQIGGTGTPNKGHVPNFVLGVRCGYDWGFEDSPSYVLAHCVQIDKDNPPVFESQATYLERLDLLLPGERKRLTAKDREPECILDIIGIKSEDDDGDDDDTDDS